jgi:hypothetical protein
MTDARIRYEDRWGAVIDYPTADIIEIRWYDTTEELDSRSTPG